MLTSWMGKRGYKAVRPNDTSVIFREPLMALSRVTIYIIRTLKQRSDNDNAGLHEGRHLSRGENRQGRSLGPPISNHELPVSISH